MIDKELIKPEISLIIKEFIERIKPIREKYGYPVYDLRGKDYERFCLELEPHLKWWMERVEKLNR